MCGGLAAAVGLNFGVSYGNKVSTCYDVRHGVPYVEVHVILLCGLSCWSHHDECCVVAFVFVCVAIPPTVPWTTVHIVRYIYIYRYIYMNVGVTNWVMREGGRHTFFFLLLFEHLTCLLQGVPYFYREKALTVPLPSSTVTSTVCVLMT